MDDESGYPDPFGGGKADTVWDSLVAATLQSVHNDTAAHFSAITETGISPYYGYKSRYARLSEAGRRAFIEAHKVPGSTPPTPRIISCINWVLHHLGEGYAAAGRGDVWQSINKIVVQNDRDGTVLMQELKKDGWTALYWNPDVKRPSDGDPEHPWTYQQVKKGKPYYGTPVDDMIINYRPTAGSPTPRDLTGLRELRRVPLWAAVANGGYHAFLGIRDQVNESHSTKNPDNIENVEQGPLAALGTTTSVKYNSGVILVPPGLWPPPAETFTAPTWVGDPCRPDDGCSFSRDGTSAECHAFADLTGEVQGFCTLPCEGYCPDEPGKAPTFCVKNPDAPSSGICVSKAKAQNGNCALIPGTMPQLRSRFVGYSGVAHKKVVVCVPAS
jgi:hypothetical protein